MFERFWSTSELSHPLVRHRHPHARVEYAGIRLSKEDVERRILIAGWPAQGPSTNETAEESPENLGSEAAAVSAEWSVAEMDREIAGCKYSNRDKAWREHFGPRKLEHGWNVEAFRSRWSEARGTKGMTGRIPKGA